ncbi:hypothetical protein HXY33_04790 [Candidatus Bathyarchaeota archaeon]|nr:hypothetical protein [Candidatus Bathyarchaeota archaeon]
MENVPSERLLKVGVWAAYTMPAEIITVAACRLQNIQINTQRIPFKSAASFSSFTKASESTTLVKLH